MADLLQQVGRQYRYDGERQHQRADQRKHDGQRHWHEELAFQALQREQRQEHDNDDQHAGGHWRGDFTNGTEHDVQARQFLRGLVVAEVLDHVLDHHHGRVHQHAQRDGQAAQAHQVGRHACRAHQDEGGQRRQRQHHRHGDGRAQVTEEGAQQHEHEHRGFHQRLRHRAHCFLDERGAVVEDLDLHTLGQGGLDVFELLRHPLDHFLRVGAGQAEYEAFHGFADTVLGDHAVTGDAAFTHLCHIAQTHRHALVVLDDDRAQIVLRLDAALGAHQQDLVAFTQPAGAVVAVVGLDGGLDLCRRQAHRGQLHGIGQDLEAAHLATQGVHIGHADDGAQGRPDHPVQHAATFFQRQSFALDGEHEHLAQRRGDRRHAAADATGQVAGDAGQALGHLLARPVDVGAVVEVDRHVDDAVLRHRAQHALFGDAQHLDLDGQRDAAFHLLGRHARGFHDDLDLRARHVGKRVDGQVLEGQPAASHQHQAGDQHEEALCQRELNKAGQHLSCSRPCRARRTSAR